MPTAKSPVDIFRELLAMTPAERKESLANRSPESRKKILQKVREYESLKPDQKELKLKVTELRWYLLPLMRAPATNRIEQLAAIPAADRKLVEERLQTWDILPPGLQQEFLDNEVALRILGELGNQKESPENVPKAPLEKWQQLSEEQRQRLLRNFNQVFSLTEREKEKVLKTLSQSEKEQIERTLRKFGTLTAGQRAECIRSFEKFANLSIEERQQFLKNAERWKLMSPDERQTWKDLVHKLIPQPPLPPGLSPPPLPSLQPPGLPRVHRAVATNGN